MKIATILAVGTGGFLGANLRLYLNGLVNHHFSIFSLPLGTLTVNLLGSFLIGLLFAIFHHIHVSINIKTFLTTGLLGALTTFSTFSYETFLLLEGGLFLQAITNISLNVFGSLTMTYIGIKLANVLF